MNIENYYWYFQSAIPNRICDDIARYGKQLQDEMAVTGGLGAKKLNQKQIKDLKKKRDSNIVWINDKWVYKEIQPYVNEANKNAGWNFQWDWSESCQFTKYEKGQFYDWHCDSWDKPYFNKNQPQDPQNGKIRKLSVTVTLSDPKEYKGGELEFDFRNMDPDKKPNIRKCKEILPKGSLVVFPSFVWHRVCPVKKWRKKKFSNMEFRMAIQVIDNFLEKEVFNNIKNIILGDNFPWYYNDFMTRDPDNKFYFTHTFYREPGVVSDWFNMWLPVIQKLDCKSIIRIKANNYCPVHKKEKNEFHSDYPFKHKGCLFYINNNNGPTYFKNKTVEAKANRAVLFDPSVPHASSLCDNRKRRVTVNFNYF